MMPKRVRRILIFVASILLGLISHYFLNGCFKIIPWSIVALCTGYISDGRRDIMVNGATFGHFLFLVYLLIAYGGKTDIKSIITIFSLLFSLIGSIAGISGTFIGNFTRKKINTINNSDKVE
jgi:hypothetical protein